MDNPLQAANLGEVYKPEPASFKFTYKYTPGEEVLKTVQRDGIYEDEMTEYHDTELVVYAKDECLFGAYVDETLNETTIHTSTKVIMKAVFSNDAEETNYVDKEIPFVSTGNGTYDAKKLYKLSVFCTSSKKYDQMMGAPGSCLSVKRLEVIAK